MELASYDFYRPAPQADTQKAFRQLREQMLVREISLLKSWEKTFSLMALWRFTQQNGPGQSYQYGAKNIVRKENTGFYLAAKVAQVWKLPRIG
jgi:hypothetical protein